MKKISLALSLLFLIILSGCKFSRVKLPFYLDDRYYGSNNLTEINLTKFEQKLKNKESFGIFVYQPLCSTSSGFNDVLDEFQEKYKISFYKISFSEIKQSSNCKYLKYYPSFIIFKDGKMVSFLDASKDDDILKYKSISEFTTWFTKYVSLKDFNESNEANNENTNNEEPNFEKITLKNITRDENKVNIYFFRGEGCPHCEDELEFFDSIKDEYGQYYNLYIYEVFRNEENKKIFDTFIAAKGDNVSGVPYTIIGNKSIKGFGTSAKDQIKKEIEEQHNNSYDIYFDKIKE